MRLARSIAPCFALSLLLFGGCGGCSEEAAEAGGSSSDASSDADAQGQPDTATDAVSDAPSDVADGASDALDVPDTTDAPSDGSDATDADASGEPECPLYQSKCGDECIPTSVDPDNCGGCGIVCADEEVCSGGRCVPQSECMSGLTACDRRCVDTDWDNDHCGECGLACPDGTGCVQGQCESVVDLDAAPSKCVDGGPLIEVGPAAGEQRSCAGRMAELTFRWGICSCEDVNLNDQLFVDAYNSAQGPYTPGGEGGGVGANGAVDVNNEVDITGTLWSAGAGGITLNNPASIGQRLMDNGPLAFNSSTTVGSDAYVGGSMRIEEGLDIAGTLHVPSGTQIDPNVTYGGLQRQVIDVGDACTECAPSDRIPVADIVAAHQNDNDNALVGLDPALLDNPTVDQPTRLDLPCGHYYLDAIEVNSETTIVAHGNTALYVAGDIKAGHEFTITLAADAQLDVFVAGDVDMANRLVLGSPNYPALMRVYIGGTGGLTVNNPTRAGAYIYAVPGGIQNNNQTEVFGGIYAQRYTTNDNTLVHFDRRVISVGNSCPDPGTDDPHSGGDAGVDTGDAADAGDGSPGGGSSTCGTEDDGCVDDSDCCSPLQCNEGVCKLLDCKPVNASCSNSSECCTDACAAGTCLIP